MKNVSDGAYFDPNIGYCIVTTNHFCSFCLLSNRKSKDHNFIALYYTYDITSPHKAHVAEVYMFLSIELWLHRSKDV